MRRPSIRWPVLAMAAALVACGGAPRAEEGSPADSAAAPAQPPSGPAVSTADARPVPPGTPTGDAPVAYACAEGDTVVATYATRDEAVVVFRGDTARLRIAIAASGARYTGDGLEWWSRGLDEGRLSRLDTAGNATEPLATDCRRIER